jgi:uncharacterized membrane protein
MWIDRRWLGAGIAASLLLNVFLVGIVAGHLFVGDRAVARPVAAGSGALVPQAHVRALPADEKKIFNTTMNTHRDAIRSARKRHRAIRLEIQADIAAPNYDRAKVAADFLALREANRSVEEAVNDALVDSLGKLSPQSRAALVNRDSAEAAKPDAAVKP